jgi:predicted amidohydrolase
MRNRVFTILIGALAACAATRDDMHYIEEEGPGEPESFRVAVLHHQALYVEVNNHHDAEQMHAHNFEPCAELIRVAALTGAKLVVTPEYCDVGGFRWEKDLDYVTVRLPDGPTTGPVWELGDEECCPLAKDYARLAHELGIYIVTNVLEQKDNPKYGFFNDTATTEKPLLFYNTLLAFDPDGRLIGKYHKQARWGGETYMMQHGDKNVSFDTPYGRFDMLVCFDCLFPPVWTDLVGDEHNVDFIVCPTLWFPAPITPGMAMNFMSNSTGKPVLWANHARGLLAGGAGIVRPWAPDTTVGNGDPPGIVVANLPLPERIAKTTR